MNNMCVCILVQSIMLIFTPPDGDTEMGPFSNIIQANGQTVLYHVANCLCKSLTCHGMTFQKERERDWRNIVTKFQLHTAGIIEHVS